VPRRRSIGSTLSLVLFAAGVVYTVALAAVLVTSQQDQRRAVEAIVVLGAAQYNGRPSPVLRARLDHAVTLYREGYAPLIVVTGGVGRGDTISEAIVGKR
jgi:vancomycin permeability regulator SanA